MDTLKVFITRGRGYVAIPLSSTTKNQGYEKQYQVSKTSVNNRWALLPNIAINKCFVVFKISRFRPAIH